MLAETLITAGVARASIVDAAIARERAHPTGLALDADGVNAAIPHADVEHVISPAIAVAVLADPVTFHRMDAPDEQLPVTLVLMLALPDADSQLSTLRAVGALLQDPVRIAGLAAATSSATVLSALGGTP